MENSFYVSTNKGERIYNLIANLQRTNETLFEVDDLISFEGNTYKIVAISRSLDGKKI